MVNHVDSLQSKLSCLMLTLKFYQICYQSEKVRVYIDMIDLVSDTCKKKAQQNTMPELSANCYPLPRSVTDIMWNDNESSKNDNLMCAVAAVRNWYCTLIDTSHWGRDFWASISPLLGENVPSLYIEPWSGWWKYASMAKLYIIGARWILSNHFGYMCRGALKKLW